MGFLSEIRDIAVISRPLNSFMGGFAVVLAAFMAGGSGTASAPLPLAIGAISVVLFMGAANALNDYLDREVDSINHPDRPIPSGRMHPRRALRASVIGFMLSVLTAPFLPGIAAYILILALVLMLSYELRLKSTGLPGNLVVAALTGMLFLYGGAITGSLDGSYVFAVLAFFSTLGREIVKDVEDMEGDIGRRTLPMIIGPRRASYIASLAISVAVAISPLPYFTGEFDGIGLVAYAVLVFLCDLAFLYAAVSAVRLDLPRERPRMPPSKVTKLAMLVGLIAFLAGRVL